MLRFTVFAAVGVALEVVFTALLDYHDTGNVRLMGQSYVWMLPIYGSIPFALDAVYPRVRSVSIPWRIIIYVALILAGEYLSGWALKTFVGMCPWEPGYRGKPWAVHGLMRLDYAPAWAVAALIFETLYLSLKPASARVRS